MENKNDFIYDERVDVLNLIVYFLLSHLLMIILKLSLRSSCVSVGYYIIKIISHLDYLLVRR